MLIIILNKIFFYKIKFIIWNERKNLEIFIQCIYNNCMKYANTNIINRFLQLDNLLIFLLNWIKMF